MSKDAKTAVAVIDDDDTARLAIGKMLRLRGCSVETFASAEEALAWDGFADVDCVVTDIKMPGMDGEQLLTEVTRQGHPAPVIMVTGHGDVPMAVRCLKAGAYDFVEKPFENDVLFARVKRAVEKSVLQRESAALQRRLDALCAAEDGRFGMVGRSRPMRDLYDQVTAAATSDAPVMIQGETGVGKELVARAIHNNSARAAGPYVAVNVGALSETVLESELFGHARGAFTGADADRDGRLVTASGGTLLLDEIESISPRAQVGLLRVIEDGLVEPVGSDETRQVDIRLLTATNEDAGRLLEQGHIRSDFYHRIMVLAITVPPLRERSEDIPALIAHFMKQTGKPVPELPEQVLAQMLHYHWPGNVRELKNAVERMVITAHDGTVGPFLPNGNQEGDTRLVSPPSTPGTLRDEIERVERDAIEAALRKHQGKTTSACRALGISRRALYLRMKKYGLKKEEFRP